MTYYDDTHSAEYIRHFGFEDYAGGAVVINKFS